MQNDGDWFLLASTLPQISEPPSPPPSHPLCLRLTISAPPPPLRAGQLLRTLDHHTDAVTTVAFAAEMGILVSAAADCTVRVWESATGVPSGAPSCVSVCQTSFHSHSGWNFPDCEKNQRAISCCRLQTSTTGALLHTMTGHTERVQSVAVAAKGHLAASGGDDKQLRLWYPIAGVCLLAPTRSLCDEVNVPLPHRVFFLKSSCILWCAHLRRAVRQSPKPYGWWMGGVDPPTPPSWWVRGGPTKPPPPGISTRISRCVFIQVNFFFGAFGT